MTDHHRHPANVARYEQATRGERIADRVTSFMGSWSFLGWQTAIIAVWITANVAAVRLHWDPYPFILLNLLFSTQAAYAAPLILLAGNRSAEHDRQRAETDHELLTAIHAHLTDAPTGRARKETAP